MTKIGYIRVSTDEQSVENQKMKMSGLGIEEWFCDEGISGTIIDRKGLNDMLNYIRKGDSIYVVSLDRLSRNSKDLEEIQAKIKVKGSTVLPLDILEKLGMTDVPSDSISKMIFDIMNIVSSFYAENERLRMLERQELGIQRAKIEGKYKGGTIKYHKNATGRNLIVYTETFKMLSEDKTGRSIAKTLNINKNTVSSMINRADIEILDYIKLEKSVSDIASLMIIPENYIAKRIEKLTKKDITIY